MERNDSKKSKKIGEHEPNELIIIYRILVSHADMFDDEKLVEFYRAASGNPHFFGAKVCLMDAQTVAKFDEEDLQLLTYLPFRDEFEHVT